MNEKISLDYTGEPNIITGVLRKGRQEMRFDDTNKRLAGCVKGRPLEAEKGKEPDFPLRAHRRNQLSQHLDR